MYTIGNKSYDEDANLKLGGGSEGDVFAFPDDPENFCVKLFHEPDNRDSSSLLLSRYRANKVQAVTRLVPSLGLPSRFKLPLKPAFKRNTIGGLLMRRVPVGFSKIMELLKMQYRVDNDINLQKICLLFANILDDVDLVHQKGLVIRDVNTGFILINPNLEREYVDTDSWSYPNFPSIATTELFCHPDLYGDLKATGKLIQAKPKHDRFSLTVMFVLMALHGAHPFRMGIHSKYSSLQERAINGVTVLDDDVKYPIISPPKETLSDDLLNQIIKILKRQTDEGLDTNDLREFASELSTCSSCGMQFHSSRHACPKCHAPSIHAVVTKVIKSLFKTDGSVLFVQVVNDSLYVACRVYGELKIAIIDSQNQSIVSTGLVAQKGTRYRFFDKHIVVCTNPYAQAPVSLEIYKIEKNGIVHVTSTTTGLLENSSALVETSGKFLYRTAGNTLLCGSFLGNTLLEEPVTSDISRNQTWFTVDRQSASEDQVVFGYDRALRDIQWFMAVGDSEGENFKFHKFNLPLRTGERQDDFTVYFNKSSVLLVRKTTYQGIENIHYTVINSEGSIGINQTLTEGDTGFEYWREIDGKLFQSSSVVHLSADGLVKQNLKTNAYEKVIGTDAVMSGDKLLKFGNLLAIVRAKEIFVYTSK